MQFILKQIVHAFANRLLQNSNKLLTYETTYYQLYLINFNFACQCKTPTSPYPITPVLTDLKLRINFGDSATGNREVTIPLVFA